MSEVDHSPLNPLEEHAGPPPSPSDPWAWCLAIPLLFGALASIRLTIPGAPYFDEVHYLPAARDLSTLLNGGEAVYRNREHPMLGKQLIALGMQILGDTPLGWRIMSLLAGIIALAASMRALWHTSHDRAATIIFGLLVASGFHLFVFARIAMLDIFMAAFLTLAAWQFAAAVREPERGRWRLALTGIAIGCALGAKWNAVPMAMAFGLAFFAARLSAGRRRLFTSRRGIPVPGISLIEAFVWLAILPLAVYALTFAPGYWLSTQFHPSPLAQTGLIEHHRTMLDLQQQVLAPHPYQSTWAQWVTNTRGIWFLYEFTDEAQRGILLIGNPIAMLLGLPALLWCLGSGLLRGDWARLAVVIGYGINLGLWLIAPKPVQFYYHYFMPSFFLLAALALSASDLYRSAKFRWFGLAIPAASLVMFALFYPILSAGALEGPMSFAKWAWIAGWR